MMNKHKIILFICFIIPMSVFAEIQTNTNVPKKVVAEKVIYDMNTGVARTEGKTTLTAESGQSLTLYDAEISKDLSFAKVEDIELYLSDSVRVKADKIAKKSEETNFYDLNYTACADKKNPEKLCAWAIGSGRLLHDNNEKQMYFHNNWFYIYSVPVLYIPWMTYPDPSVKRKTGFLFPIFSSGNRLGYQVEIPFYINFSDYHDLTVSPVFFSKQNPMIKGEHRLNLQHSSFNTVGSYIKTREGENRWHIFNNDVIELGSYARLLGAFKRTSDKTYLQEYRFYNNEPYLDSFLRLELFSEQSYLVAEGHSFQELRLSDGSTNFITTNADIIPSVHTLVQTTPVLGESYFKFFGDFLTLDYRQEDTFNSRIIGAARYVLPLTLPFGQRLELSPAIRYDVYMLNHANLINGDVDYSGDKDRILPSGYALWKWPFISFQKGLFQIIEPKVRFVLLEKNAANNFINQDALGTYLNDANLFADQRFSGYDLWDAGSYFDYGVGYTIFDSKNRSLEIFLGQAYDLYKPVDLDSNSGYRKGFSDYVGRINLKPADYLTLSYRFRFDNSNFSAKHNELSLKLGDYKNYIDFGYISNSKFDELTTEVNQSEIYTIFQLRLLKNIDWYSGIRYNIEESYLQNIVSGLTYDHSCYTIGLLYKNDRAEKGDFHGNSGVQLRFSLKLSGDVKDRSNQFKNLEEWR